MLSQNVEQALSTLPAIIEEMTESTMEGAAERAAKLVTDFNFLAGVTEGADVMLVALDKQLAKATNVGTLKVIGDGNNWALGRLPHLLGRVVGEGEDWVEYEQLTEQYVSEKLGVPLRYASLGVVPEPFGLIRGHAIWSV